MILTVRNLIWKRIVAEEEKSLVNFFFFSFSFPPLPLYFSKEPEERAKLAGQWFMAYFNLLTRGCHAERFNSFTMKRTWGYWQEPFSWQRYMTRFIAKSGSPFPLNIGLLFSKLAAELRFFSGFIFFSRPKILFSSIKISKKKKKQPQSRKNNNLYCFLIYKNAK